MRKIILLGAIAFSSCQEAKKQEPITTDFVTTNIENWKKQLLLNGEVGLPCQDSIEKWEAQFPERFYGLPKEPIHYKVFDANKDKINDVLLYFPGCPLIRLLVPPDFSRGLQQERYIQGEESGAPLCFYP